MPGCTAWCGAGRTAPAIETALPPGLLAPVRQALAGFAAAHPGTMVEDKRLSVALHFRQAPEAEAAATMLAERLAEGSGGHLRLLRGKMVVELLPAGSDKGGAIAALLDEPEFRGRTPVFVGDDVTDEAGFRRVNALGGVSMRVGHGAERGGVTGLSDVACFAAVASRRRRPADVRTAVHRFQSGHAADGAAGGRRLGGRRSVVTCATRAASGSAGAAIWSPRPQSASSSSVERGKITYALLDLTEAEHAGYYSGMANRTLWPLFHYRIDLTSFEHEWYQAYRDVARLFAERLIQLLQPDDRVWVQDFHLIPLATELRRLGFAGRLGFFLHIPFPPTQLYATMPWHRELATDLCAYDAVGFQTSTDREHFADYACRELGAQPLEGDWLRVGERTIEVHACPIGIDVKEVERLVASAEGRRQFATMHGTLGDRALIIGVDRLDYSKGIPERLRAYQALLARYPQHRRKVVLMQISAPSREDLPEYRDLRRATERLSGHLIGRYGEADWIPLRYLNRTHSRRALAGYFRAARVGLITPLRDGLNLVAEEFVAAQDADDPGMLVLSRFAGAASLLRGALIVNPYDVYEVAGAIDRALTMPLDERRERHAQQLEAIRQNDIQAWRRRGLAALAGEAQA